jgi:LPS-assembly protein
LSAPFPTPRKPFPLLVNINPRKCHGFFDLTKNQVFVLFLLAGCAAPLAGQAIYLPPIPGPIISGPQAPPSKKPVIPRPDAPPPNETRIKGIVQEVEGPLRHLRGSASLETVELLLEADEIDLNDDTKIAEARGHIHFKDFRQGVELYADRADYNVRDETGTFYQVKGSSPAKIDPRAGILMTSSPFSFEGKWAERLKDRYFLYDGFVTNCTLPHPWWIVQGPKFDIIPEDRTLAYKSLFKLKGVPILYAPVFYKSMAEYPRRSGFLTPNIGTSNKRGFMLGIGYYWAINRSYDILYRPQYFTQRGLLHMADFRGKPTQHSDFNVFFYGINDKGLEMPDGSRQKQGGYLVSVTGRAEAPLGFYARANYNYLSSFLFRQSFTESFNEAVFSQLNSIIYLAKDWSTYHLNFVFQEQENFQSTNPGDTISIRRLPEAEFVSRPREISHKVLPFWISWDTSAALMRRTQPLYQTRQFVERLDAAPRLMTALRWKDVSLLPYASIRDTYYGASFVDGKVTGQDLNRFSQEFGAELVLPSISRVYDAPRSLGSEIKHSIEPRIVFKAVRGVKDFQDIVRFDETEVVSNTTELEFDLANRLWVKRRDNQVYDMLSLELSYKRYFDPTFGGAIIPGQRNVLESGLDMTAYSFFDRPRNYSPVIASLRFV